MKPVGRFVLFSGAYAALAWFGSASAAAVDLKEYPYNETLSFTGFLGDLAAIPLTEVISTAFTQTFFPLLDLLMLASFALGSFAILTGKFQTQLWGMAAFITLPYGLLGLLALPGPYDGEWVEEGWAHLAAFPVWSLIVCISAALHVARSAGSPSSIVAPEPAPAPSLP